MGIEKRKGQHIEAVLREEVEYTASAGFEQIRLKHEALPQGDYAKVELHTRFLGKKAFPLMIVAITGGFAGALQINRALAETAEKYLFPMGLGSMRPMLEGVEEESFLIRKHCPSIPLVGNVGVAQLATYPVERIEALVSKAELDGMAVHLNPLQELLQIEGDREFSGSLEKIAELCDSLSVPVIVKETGAGIGGATARELKGAGVDWIDVSGAGGTSWSKVEYARGGTPPGFEEWGNPTAECIKECKGVLPLIGSGGVRSGIDAIKAIALGAEIAGAARPFLLAHDYGKLDEMASEWVEQMKIAAFLCGCTNHSQLKNIECTFV
ncbi:type 2 isopentenyl-diphosphate Delta-isomerase [Candidatus Micrarchaeota archaeon]|nr:type 2 isopentenyl-diphosphate Delta-isomerase [Candidatus Micrarchaeota archaeon]